MTVIGEGGGRGKWSGEEERDGRGGVTVILGEVKGHAVLPISGAARGRIVRGVGVRRAWFVLTGHAHTCSRGRE